MAVWYTVSLDKQCGENVPPRTVRASNLRVAIAKALTEMLRPHLNYNIKNPCETDVVRASRIHPTIARTLEHDYQETRQAEKLRRAEARARCGPLPGEHHA